VFALKSGLTKRERCTTCKVVRSMWENVTQHVKNVTIAYVSARNRIAAGNLHKVVGKLMTLSYCHIVDKSPLKHHCSTVFVVWKNRDVCLVQYFNFSKHLLFHYVIMTFVDFVFSWCFLRWMPACFHFKPTLALQPELPTVVNMQHSM